MCICEISNSSRYTRYARDASRTKANKAKEYLKTVTEHNPEDADAWVELAALYERTPTDKKDAEVCKA